MTTHTLQAIALITATKVLTEKNAYHLSGDADCATPDTLTSPGAEMLTRVRDGVVELLEGLDLDEWHDAAEADDVQRLNDNGAVTEIADGAPSVYTAEKWAQFVDLGAYNEDPSDLGETADMDQAGAICLYLIAERLAHALLEEAAETYRDTLADLEEDDDETEDE